MKKQLKSVVILHQDVTMHVVVYIFCRGYVISVIADIMQYIFGTQNETS